MCLRPESGLPITASCAPLKTLGWPSTGPARSGCSYFRTRSVVSVHVPGGCGQGRTERGLPACLSFSLPIPDLGIFSHWFESHKHLLGFALGVPRWGRALAESSGGVRPDAALAEEAEPG